MDTLAPTGGIASCERQSSEQSITPLLPSMEDTTAPETTEQYQGQNSSSNGAHVSTNSFQAQTGDQANGDVGGCCVIIAIEKKECDATQNGSRVPNESGKEIYVREEDAADQYSKRGTTIPIREEIRCRRLWFFYHDLRALTTSWLPLPVFVVYRIVILLYMLGWLIASGVDRSPRQGAKWLIYITNHSLLLVIIGFIAITILTVGYAIVYYIDKYKLQRFYPEPAPTAQEFYSQDKIAWYMKICWILYIVGVVTELTNVSGYWVVIYTPCPSPSMNNSANNSMSESLDCDPLDAISIHVHLIIGLLAIIDIFVSRVPYQILHFFYGVSYMAFFCIFSGIYFAAGGTDHLGNPYIYSAFDYGNNPSKAAGYCFVILLVPLVNFLLLFLLAWLRDVIYTRISFCFRDVRTSSYHIASGEKRNGQWDSNTKEEFTSKV